MAVFQQAVDDQAILNQHGYVAGATYPLVIIRIRVGVNTTSTAVSQGTRSIQRTSAAPTGTAVTPEKMNSRSPAADNTAIGTVTVNGTRTGNDLLQIAGGIIQEGVGDWTPPRPSATLTVEAGAATGIVLYQIQKSWAWGVSTSSDLAQLHRSMAGPRSRGRRPRVNGLMHFSSHCQVQGHKTATGAYDVTRQMRKWACWRVPTQYRYKAMDGALNTLNAVVAAPSSGFVSWIG